MKAYSLHRFYRLVSVDGGMVTGQFVAMLAPGDGRVLVKPHDVTVWHDPEHHTGRLLYSDSFSCFVGAGGVELVPRMIRDSVRADVEDVWDDLLAALAAVADLLRSEVDE